MIDLQTLLAAAQPAHLSALMSLSGGDTFQTADVAERDAWSAMGETLLDAGMLTYYRIRVENVDSTRTYIFDGLVPAPARALLGQAAAFMLEERRANPPAPPPPPSEG